MNLIHGYDGCDCDEECGSCPDGSGMCDACCPDHGCWCEDCGHIEVLIEEGECDCYCHETRPFSIYPHDDVKAAQNLAAASGEVIMKNMPDDEDPEN